MKTENGIEGKEQETKGKSGWKPGRALTGARLFDAAISTNGKSVGSELTHRQKRSYSQFSFGRTEDDSIETTLTELWAKPSTHYAIGAHICRMHLNQQ